MPDPLQYSVAMCLAAIASAIMVLAIGCLNWSSNPFFTSRINLASLVGISIGMGLGYAHLQALPTFPPSNALERLLAILFPAVCIVELLANIACIHRWVVLALRFGLILASGRILLHRSVYLGGPYSEWTGWQSSVILITCAFVLGFEWILLLVLSHRRADSNISWVLAVVIQCAGITTMLAGYIKGGAAAIPLVGAILGAVLGTLILRRIIPNKPVGESDVHGTIGISLMGLFGLLFIGRFFGRVSTGQATVILLAPLLCWVTELPGVQLRNPKLLTVIRLVVVAIPLLFVLILAKREFDQHMAPLL